MNIRYSFIQLLVGLIVTISPTQPVGGFPIDDSLLLSPTKESPLGPQTCGTVAVPPEQCSEEGLKLTEKKFQDAVKGLKVIYDDQECQDKEKVDEDDEDYDEDEAEEYKTCVQINTAICDLTKQNKQLMKDTRKACEDEETLKTIMKDAAAAKALSVLMKVTTICVTTGGSTTYALTKLSLDSILLSLETLQFGLGIMKDSLDSVTLFGAGLGVPLGVAIVVVESIRIGLEITVLNLDNEENLKAIDDDSCLESRATYMKEVADETEAKVDIIDTVVDDSQLILDFLSCRFTPVGNDRMISFYGAGCDGQDNDCDSTILDTYDEINRTFQPIMKRVDECDEDLVPPTIVLVKDPPSTFPSQEEAEAWYMENTVVADDCAPVVRLDKSFDSDTIGQVIIKVVDTRCVNMEIETAEVDGISRVVDGPGEPSATKTFIFVIDGKPPVITCGFFKPQDINYVSNFGLFSTGDRTDPLFIDSINEKGKLVNVEFFYQVEEIPSNPGEKISIQIKVTSNEFEEYEYDDGRKMLTIIERNNLDGPPAPVDRATLLLAPFTCGDKEAGGTCLIEKDSTARFYEINLLATDTSGNVGEATCTVAVVPEYRHPKYNKNLKSTTNRNLSSSEKKGRGKGKGSKKAPPRPSRNALIAELVRSKQRYVLHEAVAVWDTGLDEGVVTPTPTPAPTSSKSSKSTNEPVRRNK